MKKSFIKIMALALISALVFAISGCKETKDGSVIQRADLTISYTVGGETASINSTLTLYETFAPKTTERVIGLINDGFYNDTVLTLSKQSDYVVVGGFKEGYEAKTYDSTVEGEFTQNGLKSELIVKAGALVMLRDFDVDTGSVKYNSAKASFAIVLTDNGTFNASEFCVFGYIDDASLTTLQSAISNAKDDGGRLRLRYVGDRDAQGKLTSNGSFEYFLNEGGEYLKKVGDDFVQMEYDGEGDVDYATKQIIDDDDKVQDIFGLPAISFKVSLSMQSGCNR